MQLQLSIKLNIYAVLTCRLLLVLLLFSICRIAFYAYNADLFPGVSNGRLWVMMLGGVKFDFAAIIYINLLYILAQIIPFNFRFSKSYQNTLAGLFYVTNGLGLLSNVIDIAYYRYSLKRTTATVFRQFAGEQNVFKLFSEFVLNYWVLLLLFVALQAVLILTYRVFVIRYQTRITPLRFGVYCVMAIVISAICVVGVRGGWKHSTRPITLSNAGEYVQTPNEMSIVLNTPFSLIKTWKARVLQPVNTFSSEKLISLYNPEHFPSDSTPFRKLNVVILIVESLGKEHIGALNEHASQTGYKGYTPFIDSLVRSGYSFSHAYANGRKSIDALPSIISGIPSIQEPFVLGAYSANQTTSLAKLLGDEGYETAFFHGAANGSMGFSSYTQLAGIKHYFGRTEYNNDSDFDGIWGIWDEPFLQFTAKKMNSFKQPFFASVFTLSSHHPFKVPAQFAGRFPKGNLPVQESIGYTDFALRNFFAAASTMSWFKNTIFVLCADHATVSYLPEYQNNVGYFSIPIVFYYPGGKLYGRSDKIVQQIDIMPTLLNYLHYPKPYFAFGFDAFSPNNNNFAVNNNDGVYNLYYQQYLLVSDGKKSTGLFNVYTDRLLKKNLIQTMPSLQKTMETKLDAFIQQYTNRMIDDALTIKN